jgi:stage II sporulation protein GA (sporulation sigma-E factor processing peptidase)
MRKAFMQDLQRVPVQIRIRGQILRVNALVDTGNQLLDPLTGAPVIIVEYAAMASLLPIQVREVMGIGGEVNLDKMAEFTDGQFSLRLIPFTTIGKNHGMLVGFKPDEVAIQHGDQMVRRTNVVIGIYSRKLSPKGAYRALLHPDLLNASGGIN